MNRPSAQVLARRIEVIWGNPDRPWTQARIAEWVDTFEHLDEGAAGTAIEKLRATHDKCPTHAEVVNGTKALNTQDSSTREPCGRCGGDGWTTVTYEVHGIDYSGVKPCRCRNGQQVIDVHRRIVADNDTELHRFGRGFDANAIGPPQRSRPLDPKDAA